MFRTTEILKIGLIYVPVIWRMAKENEKNPDCTFKAVQGKITIVEQDPTEQSLRHILNFGHTIGHALKTVAHYKMLHREAVALGCTLEAQLSMRLGYLQKKVFEQVQEEYSLFSLRLPKPYSIAKFLSAIAHKKKLRGELCFVLIDKIRHAIPFGGAYCRTVILSKLEPTLDWMESWKSFH